MATRPAARPETAMHPILLQAHEDGRTLLLEHEVYALLASAGAGVPAHRFVASADAVDAALCSALGSEGAVVKVVSPDILHKSDVGGVAVCDNTPQAVRQTVAQVLDACRRAVPQADVRGALVAEKVRFEGGFGRELLGSLRHDPAFGCIVVVGVGGLDTEYLLGSLRPERAKAIRLTSGLDREAALAMLRGTTVHAALCGTLRSARGEGIEESTLVDLVLGLAALGERLGGFAPPGGLGLLELEVNPFVARPDGRLVALDGLARVHRPAPLASPRPVERLRHLLTPQSAVVIGASAESMNSGRIILRNLVQGGGVPQERIWCVHPRAEEIDGCRAFRSSAELPAPADMAVVAVPADRGADRMVVELVEGRHAKSVTLISGGFGETAGGREAEARMKAAIERGHQDPDGGVLVNGGNCLGIISVPGGYNTFFLPPYKLPFHDAPGQNVASISQSGAYLVCQISNLAGVVRPRYAISFGNQMDVTVADYLEYLEGDDAVQVFAVYVEGFRRGDAARFVDIARRIVAGGRPVLLYKAGRTAEGSAAAASHTASAVGDYEVSRELARAAGIIDCTSLDMFEDFITTFSFLAGRPATGRRIGVLSNAGFECTAAADKLFGLRLADLAPATRERLQKLLPPGIIDVHNPIDATPICATEMYAGCAQALLDDPGVDAVVCAGVPATPFLETLARGEGYKEDISRETSLPSRLIRIFQETRKPMVFSVDSGEIYEPFVQMLRRAGLPCFRKVDRATQALAAFVGTHR